MPKPHKITVNITNRTIVRAIFWVIVTILAFKFFGRASHALTLIFISFFLALGINPVVSWMSRHLKLKSRVKATAAAYLTVVLVLAAFFTLVIPPLIHQTRDFIKDVPSLVQNFQSQDSGLSRVAKKFHVDKELTKAAKDFTSNYGNFGGTILGASKRIITVVVSLLAVLVLTFMMLVEGPRWLELLWGILPDDDREHRKLLAYKMYKTVSGFINGQVVLAGVAATFAGIALLIASNVLGVSINVIALAGIVAMIGLIPLFGNPISSSIVILVCLLNSVTLGIVMIVYFIIYYQIESLTFLPYVQSRINELTPLMVFVAALLGISIGGFLGAIIAIPAASTIKILAEDYFKRHRHHKPATEKLSL